MSTILSQRQASQPQFYEIPEGNWDELCKRLEKLTRRATRLGNKIPILNKVGEINKVIDQKKGLIRTYYQCTIDSEPVCVDNWDFIATIELGDPEVGLIISRVPGMFPDIDIPQEYRKTTNYCSHCQKNVRRNNVYIVRHQLNGEWKQIGRNCLGQFLGGVDPENVVKSMEMLINFDGLVEGAQSDGFFGISNNDNLDLQTTLVFTNFVIQQKGWLGRAKARELAEQGEIKTPTADYIQQAYFVPERHQDRYVKQLIHDFDELSNSEKDDLNKTVEPAIEWVRSLNDEECNDYLHNLRVACSKDFCGKKNLGIVCSLLVAHQNALGKLEALKVVKEKNKNLVHVGTPGKREGFYLKVTNLHFWQNQWGGTTAILLEDENGNKLIWKSSKDPKIEIGNWYKFVGTVKGYNDYKGVPQTELSRCKVIN